MSKINNYIATADLEDVKISTITLSFTLSPISPLNLHNIIDNIQAPFTIQRMPQHFYNSVIVKYNNKYSLKVFSNGSIHVTGIKDLTIALDIVNLLTTQAKLPPPVDFKIHMTNITAKLGWKINLPILHEAITTETKLISKFNTDNHSGVITKVAQGSIFNFASGAIIFAAIKTPEQFEDMMTQMIPFIKSKRTNLETFSEPPPKRRRGRKRKDAPQDNYDWLLNP